MSNRYDLFDFLEKFVMFFNIQTLEYLSFNSNPKLFKLNNAKISPERNSLCQYVQDDNNFITG